MPPPKCPPEKQMEKVPRPGAEQHVLTLMDPAPPLLRALPVSPGVPPACWAPAPCWQCGWAPCSPPFCSTRMAHTAYIQQVCIGVCKYRYAPVGNACCDPSKAPGVHPALPSSTRSHRWCGMASPSPSMLALQTHISHSLLQLLQIIITNQSPINNPQLRGKH